MKRNHPRNVVLVKIPKLPKLHQQSSQSIGLFFYGHTFLRKVKFTRVFLRINVTEKNLCLWQNTKYIHTGLWQNTMYIYTGLWQNTMHIHTGLWQNTMYIHTQATIEFNCHHTDQVPLDSHCPWMYIKMHFGDGESMLSTIAIIF